MPGSKYRDDGGGIYWDGTPEEEQAYLTDPVRLREEAKEIRQRAVEAIKVTTSSGRIFDGDETSQGRMARAIIAMQALGVPTVTWVLADNTAIQATVMELVEALALAGAAQAQMWVIEV